MRYIFLLALPAFLISSCGDVKLGGTPPPDSTKNCFCSDPSKSAALCPDIPHEINPALLPGTAGYKSVLSRKIQPAFDVFSWQSFIALNWPANANGDADTTASILTNTTALRVWECYPLADTVFKPAGGQMKFKLKPGNLKAAKELYQSTAFADDFMIADQFFEADSSTLIDKNLNYVLYEERINDDEWDFINSNGLRTQAGQMNYVNENGGLYLPAGSYPKNQYGQKNLGEIGAIEIKASWRILDPAQGDDTSRYYHQQAHVSISGKYTWSGKTLEFVATVGLVGIHIVHKTAMFQREIWSTFEHIDNVPDDLLEAHDPQHGYSFYQPQCFSCPANEKPGAVKGKYAMWNDTPPYASAYAVSGTDEQGKTALYGSQITRMFPVFESTDSLNNVFRAKLAGTVWANYHLIGSQWFKGSTDGPHAPIAPNAPARLSNTTLETFEQSYGSCTSCHGFAYIAGAGSDSLKGNKYKSDFSFLFRKASNNPLGNPAQVPAPPKGQ